LPVVDKFFEHLRTVVSEAGGPAEFFARLADDSDVVTQKIEVEYRNTLSKLLDDTGFRVRFARQIGKEEDRRFLDGFLEAWDLWSELSPDESQPHAPL
jgi:hypothetical protein